MNNLQISNHIKLYTIDFVHSILEHYHFPIRNVFLLLEKVKYIQLNLSDLSLWFMSDNEVKFNYLYQRILLVFSFIL